MITLQLINCRKSESFESNVRILSIWSVCCLKIHHIASLFWMSANGKILNFLFPVRILKADFDHYSHQSSTFRLKAPKIKGLRWFKYCFILFAFQPTSESEPCYWKMTSSDLLRHRDAFGPRRPPLGGAAGRAPLVAAKHLLSWTCVSVVSWGRRGRNVFFPLSVTSTCFTVAPKLCMFCCFNNSHLPALSYGFRKRKESTTKCAIYVILSEQSAMFEVLMFTL